MKKNIEMIIVMAIFLNLLVMSSDIGTCDEFEINILIVDDDGDKEYSTIKDALDNASDGDYIHVYNGTYDGYFTINKSVTILGEGKNNTIIDGGNYLPNSTSLIKIKADNVILQGFNIQNSKRDILLFIEDAPFPFDYYDYGIGLEITSDNNQIFENKIQRSAGYALLLNKSNNNIISNNEITNNEDLSIYLKNSSDNTIYKNNISNNLRGIVFHINSTDNLLYQNNFINNSIYHAFDESNNIFYNSAIMKGNYWDDYTGIDTNNDGLGDTSYEILGGESKDIYPLIKPYTGEKPFTVNFDQLFNMLTIGLIIAVVVCIPIAYYWRKKYFT